MSLVVDSHTVAELVLPWATIRNAASALLPRATLVPDQKWVRAAVALLPPSLNPRAGLASDRAQSLITLVALALLCESCHWVQDDHDVERPLESIIDAAQHLGIAPAQLRELRGWPSTVNVVDVELPWLVYESADKLSRHIVPILRSKFRSNAELAKWYSKFLRTPDEAHEDEREWHRGLVEEWCERGCTNYV